MNNYMKLEITARGENEGFARSAVAAFALFLNPSLSELSDIKTAVSEAVTNCVVHAYTREVIKGKIIIECFAEKDAEGGGQLHIRIQDFGCGIEDVERAVSPFYTTMPEDERSGMGFTIMKTFMHDFSLESKKGAGTTVRMLKRIGFNELCEEGAERGEKAGIHA